MINKLFLAGAGLMFAFPGLSLAATYHYIDIFGNVQTIQANNASEALMIESANGNALHSGVALDQGFLNQGDDYGIVFQYTSTDGTLKTVTAASPDAAYLVAHDILPGSLHAVAVERGDEVVL